MRGRFGRGRGRASPCCVAGEEVCEAVEAGFQEVQG